MKPNQPVRVVSALVLASVTLTAQVARKVDVPLNNWAAPLYWRPNQAEREAAGSAVPELKFSANQISNDALTFVAITPCRLVDTRGAAAGFIGVTPFNGPGVPAGGGNLTFPVQSSAQTSTTAPAPCGAIPSFAAAYSINLTVVPVAGGAVDNVSLWPAGSTQPFVATLNDPQGIIAQNAAIVPAGTPFGGFSFHSTGPAATDIVIDMNGYYTAPSDLNLNTAIGFGALGNNSTGTNNTAVGAGALQANSTGLSNTANGVNALFNNTTGNFNTASGANALAQNTTGSQNTASGYLALQDNTTGINNTASGAFALKLNTTGANNTAGGDNALGSNTTGDGNTASGSGALQANTTGSENTASGVSALQNNTTGYNNTASGFLALLNNTTGDNNTATGVGALEYNTTGFQNTASGVSALQDNTTGGGNTASGFLALFVNTTGNSNTASGSFALEYNTTGGANTATGVGALEYNTTGDQNTASGFGALLFNTTGSSNIAIGNQAASNVSNGNSNNIDIGSQGVAGDGAAANSGVIRIGTAGTQTSFFVAGVSGVATGLSSPVAVMIDANGQLGTMSSSRRFKEDIQDMGDASSGLMSLRPVTFRYKQPYTDGSKPIDYGLIAEEVADVYPDLVAYSPSGEVQTVQYQKVNAMLLNEVQKQHQQILQQNGQIQEQKQQAQTQQEQTSAEISTLKAHVAELQKLLEALAAQK